MRKLKVTINDLHGGHRLGLLNPETILQYEDENGNLIPYSPSLTASQEYLWDLYLKQIEEAKSIANGCEILLLVNGDLTQGDKYIHHWVSTRLSDQILIAVFNLTPWYKLPNLKNVRISIGTGAHNFQEGSAEFLIAEILSHKYPSISTKVATHGLLTYEQVVFDYAHHGPFPGSRDWLKGNVARFYLRDLMYRERMRGSRPPDVVERAHYHTPVFELLENGNDVSTLFVVPSFCMADDHATQATRSLEKITHGMLVFECDEGKYDFHRLYETIDTRTVEVL